MRFVDLSHPIVDGMITHPGLPGPAVGTFRSFDESIGHYAPGVEFEIGRIEMVGNTGTYVDAAGHRYRDAGDSSSLPLERLADLGIALVQVSPDVRAIGPEIFDGTELRDRAVLIHTGWDRHWGTPAYLTGNPFLTADAAAALVAAEPALVGIDSLNIDDVGDPARPAHSAILRARIPLVEHLCGLGRLAVPAAATARFFAVPMSVRGLVTVPVRAFAIVEG